MDTKARHALKQDALASAASNSAHWMSDHRSGLVRSLIIGGVAVLVVIGCGVYVNMQSTSADAALGTALDTYNAQLTAPGAPPQSGLYASASERSKKANEQFAAVASKYGWLSAGTKAHYFLGVTDADLGQNAAAESELKIAAGSWDRGVSNLAKLALANLYRASSRDNDAADLLNQIVAKPSATVPETLAQLDLAELYATTGKKDQARALWAKIKDADKDGIAGTTAAKKLSPGQ